MSGTGGEPVSTPRYNRHQHIIFFSQRLRLNHVGQVKAAQLKYRRRCFRLIEWLSLTMPETRMYVQDANYSAVHAQGREPFGIEPNIRM